MIPAVLREQPRFRLLFLGQALSMLGDRVSFVVLPFAVLSIGGIADVGIVTAAGTIPFLIVAIPGGSVSDRLGRREVMLASDLVRAATQITMAVLLVSGSAEVWMLAALMACFGCAEAFFGPAFNGLIPQTVPAGQIQEANAALGLLASASLFVGPTIAGVVLALTGPGEAIGFDALTFLVSAACLARLRVDAVPRAEGEPASGMLGELRRGWEVVRATGWMLPGLRALVAYHVCVLPSVFVLGPALAQRDLNGATSWAVITTAFGVGSIIGSAVLLRYTPRRPVVAVFTAMLVASLQGAIIASGTGTAGIAALELVAGIGVAFMYTFWETTIQEQIPPHATARAAAYDWGVSVGLMPVGIALAAPIAAAIGLTTAMRWGSGIGVAMALAALAHPAVRGVVRPSVAGG